jgi:7-dehydrocholesterol reductase
MIKAKYMTKDDEERSSLLLASGWWGISRHFHYIPEILSAFFWTVPFACEVSFFFFSSFFLNLLSSLGKTKQKHKTHLNSFSNIS